MSSVYIYYTTTIIYYTATVASFLPLVNPLSLIHPYITTYTR